MPSIVPGVAAGHGEQGLALREAGVELGDEGGGTTGGDYLQTKLAGSPVWGSGPWKKRWRTKSGGAVSD